ncbi:MAG: phosphodiester glycosidase family protein, partial [Casimicrobium sp.]
YAKAKLEGLFFVDGEAKSELKPSDRQLTHVFSLDRNGRFAAVREASTTLPEKLDTSGVHIQSGPLILDDGKLATNFIEGSLNGSDAYKRTALGRTRAGETVIVIAKTPRTLAELAKIVLSANNYASRGLTLINLDGGPSTAIHANAVRGLSYGADKITPVGFGLRDAQ